MEPIYVDLHIHTSENPNQPNPDYPAAILLKKVKENAKGNGFLISLTDHNMLNKKAYLDIAKLTGNILIGVELHVKKYCDTPPYHCHIFLDKEINESNLDEINSILNKMYPNKVVTDAMTNIPSIEDIINYFEGYDFVLLPHGGQSERTFDKAVPHDGTIQFDNTLERSLYYNQFDGFTARSDQGVNETIEYFKRLGIHEFVNLITGSDNYNPNMYPQPKNKDANAFKPTWMYATPSFQGLRLSLSESSRFQYLDGPPSGWAEYITCVKLASEKLDIDVTLSPGLNVVIGGSSSGKTLFVDSLYRKLNGSLDDSKYLKLGVNELAVVNPSQIKPHYINQNYIVNVLSEDKPDISKIEMIKRAFPINQDIESEIQSILHSFKDDLHTLISSVSNISSIEKELTHIPNIVHLITPREAKKNIVDYLFPTDAIREKITITNTKHQKFMNALDEMLEYLNGNPFIDAPKQQIQDVKDLLDKAYEISEFELSIKQLIDTAKENLGERLKVEDHEAQTKKQNKERLIELFKEYYKQKELFNKALASLSRYNLNCASDCIIVSEHKLQMQNSFVINKEVIKDVFNAHLKANDQINSFDEITPKSLYAEKFSKQKPKVEDYDDFCHKVSSEFERKNERIYKITTKDGMDFSNISPGWKCAVLLDIILGYNKDIAPIIIDQPEDNLATYYINHGLIDAIKKVKKSKQVILVSHNATIPMLGDAQNIVLCQNSGGKIIIRSSPLEGRLSDKSIVDHIAEITDGGKSSIKKRVKKYNLKKFREEG